MKNKNLKPQHLETDEDVEHYLDLVQEIWRDEPGVKKLARRLIENHPRMTLKNFYVIKDKDKMVSTLNLIPLKWSIGGVKLKVAEMGFVGTLPEYRRQGLIRKLVEEFHKDIKNQLYDIAVIEGIPCFYRQFEYEYAIPLLEETRIRLDQIPEWKPKITIRPFTERDLSKARVLLERSQKRYYVHSIRDEIVWELQQKTSIASDPEPFECYAVEEQTKMTAYFRVRKIPNEKELILTEITEVDQLAAQAVLSFLKDYGNRHRLETLSANISYAEPFTEFLMSLGGVRRVPTYAWQIRITDYVRIFRKLKPLFERRLANSMYDRLTEVINFNFRSFTIQVAFKAGRITSIQQIDKGE
ncbi:MAG TPA: GNAT family N-acetyltransferase, partial [Candidatus Acidoferrum sp.]|nr:GNAT family N-acetyltransferase [Candidatus Acidoferrum sp.]